ncbi:hypothetical protein IPL85_01960 [Candidatus Saccharibacteria bacterium]|nr:MAG: hypothetical protein IPL85_01960 [Candidatus Saccharibacteria bacterium]
MKPLRLRTMFFLGIFLILLTVLTIFVRNYLNSRPLTVIYQNVSALSIYDVSGREAGGKDVLLKKLAKSGETVRIPKAISSVLVVYSGASGYADGFKYADSQSVTITPEYSRDKIKSLIGEQWGEIQSAVFSELQNQSSYSLAEGTLLMRGNWYISKLTHVDPLNQNSDTLRVLLNKTEAGWVRVGTPRLVYSVFSTSDVPADVLDAVNAF